MGFALKPEYGWVLAALGVTGGILQYMGIKVGLARKKYSVNYPKMYADGDSDAANKFNCVQRGHQNTLEGAPGMMLLSASLGLAHPLTAASFLMVYNVGRLVYFHGYSSGDPQKRAPGAMLSALPVFAAIGTAVVVGISQTGALAN